MNPLEIVSRLVLAAKPDAVTVTDLTTRTGLARDVVARALGELASAGKVRRMIGTDLEHLVVRWFAPR